MEKLYLIVPNKEISPMLDKMIKSATAKYKVITLGDVNNIPDLKNQKILFAMELNEIGCDIPMISFLHELSKKGNDALEGSVGALLVHSCTELGTKRSGQDLIYLTNNLGCSFIGHPLVEATHSMRNFMTWQKTLKHMTLEEICLKQCAELTERLIEYKEINIEYPKILVLYSSPHKTSNTLDLWHMVSKHLEGYSIKKLQIENGDILDCKGCSYKLCIHYAKENKCFYGGMMVKEVLPSIEDSDVIVWLCPNYNDSIAANLTAAINRLTVLYRRISFSDKTMFGVVVSGNSGSDSVAKQLLGSLNINKGFKLPPNFSINAIANDPGAIFDIEDIETRAEKFAENIKESLKINHIDK